MSNTTGKIGSMGAPPPNKPIIRLSLSQLKLLCQSNFRLGPIFLSDWNNYLTAFFHTVSANSPEFEARFRNLFDLLFLEEPKNRARPTEEEKRAYSMFVQFNFKFVVYVEKKLGASHRSLEGWTSVFIELKALSLKLQQMERQGSTIESSELSEINQRITGYCQYFNLPQVIVAG
jgi:hypothetical protein